MNLKELISLVEHNQEKNIKFYLKNKEIPNHFHLTEIGKQNREFIDCGGTKRKTEHCVLQIWVAEDLDHRLKLDKMLKILNLGMSLFEHDIPDVFVEYEDENVSQHPIVSCRIEKQNLCFYLGEIHTACLAPDKCGIGCKPQIITQIQSCKHK